MAHAESKEGNILGRYETKLCPTRPLWVHFMQTTRNTRPDRADKIVGILYSESSNDCDSSCRPHVMQHKRCANGFRHKTDFRNVVNPEIILFDT